MHRHWHTASVRASVRGVWVTASPRFRILTYPTVDLRLPRSKRRRQAYGDHAAAWPRLLHERQRHHLRPRQPCLSACRRAPPAARPSCTPAARRFLPLRDQPRNTSFGTCVPAGLRRILGACPSPRRRTMHGHRSVLAGGRHQPMRRTHDLQLRRYRVTTKQAWISRPADMTAGRSTTIDG